MDSFIAILACGLLLGLSVDLARRHELESPGFVFVTSLFLSQFVLVAVHNFGLYPAWLKGWWQVRATARYSISGPSEIQLGLGCLAYCVAVFAARKKGPVRVPASRSHAAYRFVKSPVLTLGLGILVIIGLAHAATVRFNYMSQYRDYLSARGADALVTSNPVILSFHRVLPLLGALLAPLAVFAIRAGASVTSVLASLLSLYALVFSLGFGSRFAVLEVVLAGLATWIVSGRLVRRVIAGPILVSSIFVYAAILRLRSGFQFTSSGTYGWRPFAEVLSSGHILFAGLLSVIVFSNFGGGFVLAAAMHKGPLYYPVMYKVLSYSPFPSMLDGFDEWRGHAVRINASAPLSSTSEALAFGFPYTIIFVAIVLLTIYLVRRAQLRLTRAQAFIIATPAYYALLKLQLYPLRNTMRWLLLACLMSALVMIRRRWMKRRFAR